MGGSKILLRATMARSVCAVQHNALRWVVNHECCRATFGPLLGLVVALCSPREVSLAKTRSGSCRAQKSSISAVDHDLMGGSARCNRGGTQHERQIMLAHGGTLAARSSHGTTTFTMRLPRGASAGSAERRSQARKDGSDFSIRASVGLRSGCRYMIDGR